MTPEIDNKYVQMLVVGKPVTREQAREIISRTGFEVQSSIYKETMFDENTFSLLFEDPDTPRRKGFKSLGFFKTGRDLEKIMKTPGYLRLVDKGLELLKYKFQHIPLEHTKNEFYWNPRLMDYYSASWILERGEIRGFHNIGKYPSYKEVFSEWKLLSSIFPYLDLYVTVMNSDKNGFISEGHKVLPEVRFPIFSLRIKNGKIGKITPTLKPFEFFNITFEEFESPNSEVISSEYYNYLSDLLFNYLRSENFSKFLKDYSEVLDL